MCEFCGNSVPCAHMGKTRLHLIHDGQMVQYFCILYTIRACCHGDMEKPSMGFRRVSLNVADKRNIHLADDRRSLQSINIILVTYPATLQLERMSMTNVSKLSFPPGIEEKERNVRVCVNSGLCVCGSSGTQGVNVDVCACCRVCYYY